MTRLCAAIVAIFKEKGVVGLDDQGGYSIRRTYAGSHQRAAGSLSWTLKRYEPMVVATFGSWQMATELVKAYKANPKFVEVNGYRDVDVVALETTEAGDAWLRRARLDKSIAQDGLLTEEEREYVKGKGRSYDRTEEKP